MSTANATSYSSSVYNERSTVIVLVSVTFLDEDELVCDVGQLTDRIEDMAADLSVLVGGMEKI